MASTGTESAGEDEVRRLRAEVADLRAVVAAATEELSRRTDEAARCGIDLDAARLEIARLEALVASQAEGAPA